MVAAEVLTFLRQSGAASQVVGPELVRGDGSTIGARSAWHE